MARYGQDRRAFFGARQNMDFTHPAYRYHAGRIICALVSRFAAHPVVIGWQIDNETGTGMLYNPNVFLRFVDHLKGKYGTAERLNEFWGLNYWSHRIYDWAELWTPDGNTNPSYDLEWRRFQSALTTEFLSWQTQIVREYARSDQFITQDLVGGFGRPDSDRYQVAQVVDILSENPYHTMQAGLALPENDAERISGEWMPSDGAWALWCNGDFGRSGRQTNFLVTEVNAYAAQHSLAYEESGRQWIMEILGAPQLVDFTWSGGETLRLGPDWTVEIHHTPGHTAGHLTIFDPRHRVALIGDAVHGALYRDIAGNPALCPTYIHIDTYLATIRYLRTLGAEVLAGCHWPVKRGDEVTAFLDESAQYVTRVDRALQDVLQNRPEGATLGELIATLGPQLGDWTRVVDIDLMYSLAGHLDRLVAQGQVTLDTSTHPVHYSAARAEVM
jgi:glyoxylase-like metal-dependent hydrolase (beta-lactamase superfamily II)